MHHWKGAQATASTSLVPANHRGHVGRNREHDVGLSRGSSATETAASSLARLGFTGVGPLSRAPAAPPESRRGEQEEGLRGPEWRDGHPATNARRFSEGLAAVQEGSKWGFVDTTGTMVIARSSTTLSRSRKGWHS